MAKVHILNVTVHNNPAPFFTPFQFEIHFECLEELQDDLEFKIIYVGSAETYEFDQTLDQIVVDAVPQGQFKFMFQADPPETSKIPADDAVGVTVILITASYREQEFVRVGYYVTNEYEDPELREIPPTEPQFDKLVRTIAANEPRVTKFKINWDSKPQADATVATAEGLVAEQPQQQEQQQAVVSSLPPGAPLPRINPTATLENKENINQQQATAAITNTKLNGNESQQNNSTNYNYLQNTNGVIMNGEENMVS